MGKLRAEIGIETYEGEKKAASLDGVAGLGAVADGTPRPRG